MPASANANGSLVLRTRSANVSLRAARGHTLTHLTKQRSMFCECLPARDCIHSASLRDPLPSTIKSSPGAIARFKSIRTSRTEPLKEVYRMKQTIKQSIQGETRAGVWFYRLGCCTYVVYIRAPFRARYGLKQCPKFWLQAKTPRISYFEDAILCIRESWLHIDG